MVAKKVELKKTPLKPVQTREAKAEAEAKAIKPATAPLKQPEPQARVVSTAQPRHAPALPVLKPPSPAQIKSTTAHSLQRQKRAYSVLSI